MHIIFSKVKLIRSLLIAVSIAITSYFFYLVIPLILNRTSNNTAFGNNLPITNPSKFVAALNVDDNNDGKKVVALNAILIPAKPILGDKSDCINGITFLNQVDIQHQEQKELWDLGQEIHPPSNQPVYVLPSNPQNSVMMEGSGSSFSDICANNNPQAISLLELQNQYGLKDYSTNLQDTLLNRSTSSASFTATTTTITPVFFYPFDRYKIQLNISLQAQGNPIRPDIIGEIHSSDWDVLPIINETDLVQKPTLEILYSRPYSLRYLVSVLLLSLLLIIIFSMFIKDIATYFGVLLGVLLGMNGLRPIMNLPEGTGSTMIDAFFLSFYILMGITFFMRFAILPLWNMVGQEKSKNTPRKPKSSKKTPIE